MYVHKLEIQIFRHELVCWNLKNNILQFRVSGATFSALRKQCDLTSETTLVYVILQFFKAKNIAADGTRTQLLWPVSHTTTISVIVHHCNAKILHLRCVRPSKFQTASNIQISDRTPWPEIRNVRFSGYNFGRTISYNHLSIMLKGQFISK